MAALRVAAPGHRDAERRRRVDLLARGRSARTPGRPRSPRVASRCASVKIPSSIVQLGERGEHRRPLGLGLARDELDGPAGGRASRHPDRPPRAGCGRAARGGVRAGPGRGGRRGPPMADLEVGRRARRPPDREGRLGRPAPGDPTRSEAGRSAPTAAVPVGRSRGSESASSSAASSSAAACRAPRPPAASIAAAAPRPGRGPPASAGRRPPAARPAPAASAA